MGPSYPVLPVCLHYRCVSVNHHTVCLPCYFTYTLFVPRYLGGKPVPPFVLPFLYLTHTAVTLPDSQLHSIPTVATYCLFPHHCPFPHHYTYFPYPIFIYYPISGYFLPCLIIIWFYLILITHLDFYLFSLPHCSVWFG